MRLRISPLSTALTAHTHIQEVESSLVALRNQKLKEERDAQQKAAKKSASRPLPMPHARFAPRPCSRCSIFVATHSPPSVLPTLLLPPTAAAKAKPQLKGNIEGDLDDVRYSQEALDEYDFM